MAEREAVKVKVETGLQAQVESQTPTEPPAMTEAERIARIATILDRGYLNDRLMVDLPPELVGEWTLNHPNTIARKEALGWRIDDKYAPSRALHSDGTGRPIIGDVVHMVIDRETYNLFEKIRQEKFDRQNRPRHKQAEEEGLIINIRGATDGDIPAFSDSVAKPATAEDLRDALAALARQQRTQ